MSPASLASPETIMMFTIIFKYPLQAPNNEDASGVLVNEDLCHLLQKYVVLITKLL